MGMFSETAIVENRLSFADKGKQLLFFVSANKRKLAVSLFRLQQRDGSCRYPSVQFSVYGILEIWRQGHVDMGT
jgi:hypothetical protein